MESTVDRIKRILKERGIPVSHFERACGFANGYLSQLRKGTMPAERLLKSAEFLELSPEYLLTGEDPHYQGIDPSVLQIAQALQESGVLADSLMGLTPEDAKRVADFADALKKTYKD